MQTKTLDTQAEQILDNTDTTEVSNSINGGVIDPDNAIELYTPPTNNVWHDNYSTIPMIENLEGKQRASDIIELCLTSTKKKETYAACRQLIDNASSTCKRHFLVALCHTCIGKPYNALTIMCDMIFYNDFFLILKSLFYADPRLKKQISDIQSRFDSSEIADIYDILKFSEASAITELVREVMDFIPDKSQENIVPPPDAKPSDGGKKPFFRTAFLAFLSVASFGAICYFARSDVANLQNAAKSSASITQTIAEYTVKPVISNILMVVDKFLQTARSLSDAALQCVKESF